MPLYAFKNGDPDSRYTEDRMNSLLAMQEFSLIYEGTQRDAKVGSGVEENNVANYNFCARFTLTGSTEIGRVEIEVDKDGDGADLVVQIRSGMNPAAGVDGTLIKEVVIPKEFIPATAAYWSVPIGLSGLAAGATYWLVVKQGGDAVNHLDWVGEAAQDENYPAYSRNGSSGAWTASNALHFKVFSGANGDLKHGVYGNGHTKFEYSGETINKVYKYLPPADGPDGGIRDIITYSWSGDFLVKGVVG